MRFRLAGKVIGGLVLIGIAGTVGVITYVNHSRPAELGLASVTPRATASATPDDPLTLACRRPSLPAHDASSGVPGLWVVQPGSVAGDLEIGGVTRPERFALDVRLQQGQVAAAGRATVQAGDFAIEVPQEADGFVRVDPQITLEVSLVLLKA